jgi:transcriptional regulator with XRE-family HTH domain
MEIGPRLKALREQKHLSQGDIENKTGLLRCYVSRVENEHTIPNVDSLEKFARALEIPLYQLFTDGQPVDIPKLPSIKAPWGTDDKDRSELRLFVKAFRRLDERGQKLLMGFAQKMATRHVKKIRYVARNAQKK